MKTSASNYREFPYFVCKVVSAKCDEINGIKIYSGQAPISAFIGIPDDENVRRYTIQANAEAQKSKKSSEVHRAIRETLDNRPSDFSLLNGGITLVSTKVEFSNEKKGNILTLHNANIINGSQTRGVISDFLGNNKDDKDKADISVKFEIIETKDADLISDISIARNMQIRVEKVSIMGKEGIFDEFEESINRKNKSLKLKKSETDRGEQYLPTEKILQVIATLVPKQLWEETGNRDYSKAPYYSRQSRALNLYKAIYDGREGKKNSLYKFYLDIAYDAWQLYSRWSNHPGFEGKGFHNGKAVDRDDKKNIVGVYDGIIFPIIAAHALFVSRENDKWALKINQQEKIDNFLIEQAKRVFQEIAGSKAEKMGKDQVCYSQLYSLIEAITNSPLN